MPRSANITHLHIRPFQPTSSDSDQLKEIVRSNGRQQRLWVVLLALESRVAAICRVAAVLAVTAYYGTSTDALSLSKHELTLSALATYLCQPFNLLVMVAALAAHVVLALLSLYWHMQRLEQSALGVDDIAEKYNLHDQKSHHSHSTFFVITPSRAQSQTVIGCIGLMHHQSNNTMEIRRLYTHLKFQRLGVATTLLQHIEEYASKHGISKLWLETTKLNSKAIQLYESNEYKKIKATAIAESWLTGNYLYIYKKVLSDKPTD